MQQNVNLNSTNKKLSTFKWTYSQQERCKVRKNSLLFALKIVVMLFLYLPGNKVPKYIFYLGLNYNEFFLTKQSTVALMQKKNREKTKIIINVSTRNIFSFVSFSNHFLCSLFSCQMFFLSRIKNKSNNFFLYLEKLKLPYIKDEVLCKHLWKLLI